MKSSGHQKSVKMDLQYGETCKKFKEDNFFSLVSSSMQEALRSMQVLCENLDTMKLIEAETIAMANGILPAKKSLSEQGKKLYYCYEFTKRKCFLCKNSMLIEGDEACDEDIDDSDLVIDEDGLCFKKSSSKRFFNSLEKDKIPTYPRHYPFTKDLRTIKVKGTSLSVYDFMNNQHIVDEEEEETKMDENALVDVMNRYIETEASHITLDVENIQNWNKIFGNLVLPEHIVCNLIDTGINFYNSVYTKAEDLLPNLNILITRWKKLLNDRTVSNPSPSESLERMIIHLNEFNKLAETKANTHYVIIIKSTMIQYLQQSLDYQDISRDPGYYHYSQYFGSVVPTRIRAFIPNNWNRLILTPIPVYRNRCIAAFDDFLTELTTRSPLPTIYESYRIVISAYSRDGVLFHYLKLGYIVS